MARPRAAAASIDADRLRIVLANDCEISVPVGWFDWLLSATDEQRQDLRIIEGGAGIWWEQLEDGISVPGLLGLPEYP